MAEKISAKEKIKHVVGLLDNWLDFQTYYKEIPGVSVGVYCEDEILFQKSYGYKNLESKEKADSTTLYRIASHSKLFTATAIMKLYAEDKLSLDDRVSTHLTWFYDSSSSTPDELRDIRIRHLLTHSSGITRDGTLGQWMTDKFPSLDEFKAEIKKGVKILEPSTHFKYSNIGFTLLGLIIEAITNKSYSEYISAEILKPLKLYHTFTDISDTTIAQHATGYGRKFPKAVREKFEHVNARVMNSATGFSSTVEDMIGFYTHHIFGNDVLFPDVIKYEMQRVQFKDKNTDTGTVTEWGLGFEKNWSAGELEFVGHGGGYPGFITRSGLNQKHKLIIVVLTNAIDGPAQVLSQGIALIINEILKKFEKFTPEKELTSETLQELAGFYYGRWPMTLVQQINGKLVSINPIPDNPIETLSIYDHIKETTFKIPLTMPFGSPGESLTFFDKNGKKHIEQGGYIQKPFIFTY